MTTEHGEPEHRIVVGVDGSAPSKAALAWAIRQARLTGATVDAVIAWEIPLTVRTRGYLDQAARAGVDLVVAPDLIVAAERDAGGPPQVVSSAAIPADRMGLDIGPESAKLFADRLATANTVFWNGPMGVSEIPRFADGTRTVAQALADSTAFTVVGGGDTAAAVRALGFPDNAFGHISTGGGASLEYLEGKTLPGLAALQAPDAVDSYRR